jgi:hypothetical protein
MRFAGVQTEASNFRTQEWGIAIYRPTQLRRRNFFIPLSLKRKK